MINDLNELFNDDVKLNVQDVEDVGKCIVLTEGGLDASIKKLFICEIPDDIFALTLDVDTKGMDEKKKIIFSRLNHYFNKGNSKGINKRCDLVLFHFSTDGLHVIIFDLKSSDPDMSSTVYQLKNSQLYIEYVINVLKEFYSLTQTVFIHKVMGSTRVKKTVTNGVEKKAKILRDKKLLEENKVKEVFILCKSDKSGKIAFNKLISL